MPRKLIVKINDVGVYDKKSLHLTNLNLNFYENDSIALVGSNGSGKTTIAKIITSEIIPSSGFVKYSFDIKEIHKYIGYQFRHNNWSNGYKTKDIITLYKYIHNVIDDEWFDKLMEVFNLYEIWDRELASCSYIWHQIISMVLAIICKPKILIVDSISSIHGLDEKIRIINFLKEYREKNKVLYLFLSPDEMIVKELCNRVLGLDNKNIVEDFLIDEGFDFNNYQLEFLEKTKKNQTNEEKILKEGLLEEYVIREKIILKIQNKVLKAIDGQDNLDESAVDKMVFKNIIFHSKRIKNIIQKMQMANTYSKKEVRSIKTEIKKILKYDKKIYGHLNLYPNLKELYEEFNIGFIDFLKYEFRDYFKSSHIQFNKLKIKLYDYKKDKELKKMKKQIIANEIKKIRKDFKNNV